MLPAMLSALAPASPYRVRPWTRTAYIPAGVPPGEGICRKAVMQTEQLF